jgi:hypothetical protein
VKGVRLLIVLVFGGRRPVCGGGLSTWPASRLAGGHPGRGLVLTPARTDADFGSGADVQAGRLGGVGGAVCRTVVLAI